MSATEQLPEVERARIRCEEQYRLEIRHHLEEAGASSKRRGLLKFLNSPLGLWLLSALVLSFGGTLWSRCQARRDAAAQHAAAAQQRAVDRATEIERLDLEISYRFSLALIGLHALTDGPPHYRTTPDAAAKIGAILHAFYQPIDDGLYADYARFSTLALIAEQRRHVTGTEQKDHDVRMARLVGTIRENRSVDARQAAGVLLELMAPRWKAGWWWYTDCSSANPFC